MGARRAAGVGRAGIVVLLGVLLGACGEATTADPGAGSPWVPEATPSPLSTPAAAPAPGAVESFADLRTILAEIATLAPAAAQARADELWSALASTHREPLVLGRTVVFFHRGDATQVHWRGSFNGWAEPGLAGTRVGATDLWVGSVDLPAASRVEYKIVRDGTEWLVDPANPVTAFSGLTGVNNVVVMPGFTVTDESEAQSGVTPGRLEGGHAIASRHLGYPVAYWIYTPAGFEALAPLPVLYVLDGNDFVDERMGALPTILDNMIAAGRIDPLIAVFVDAREPGDPTHNRREEEFLANPVEHARFIVDELVPAVDEAYPTKRDRAARAIAGVSYGGVGATFVAFAHPDVFGSLAAFSPSLWVIDSPEYLTDPGQAAGARLMAERLAVVTACGGAGSACPAMRIFLSGGIPDWDVGDLSSLASTLARMGYDVDFEQAREGHTWDQWRGLSDEMLAFLFGPPGAATP